MPVIRHATSHADQLRVLAVGHAATSADQPFALYAGVRFRVPRRRTGTWWLLEEEGEAASSLLCYPLLFRAGDRLLPGYGIGAVATRPENRKRGFASELCRHAIEASEAQGRSVGLLFSAIPPAIYERLGFTVVPAWEPVCEDLAALADSGPRADLAAFDGRAEANRVAELYTAHHTGLHLARDADGVRTSTEYSYEDIFLGLGEPLRGYVRLYRESSTLELVECVVPPEETNAVLRSVADLARGAGCGKVQCWLEPATLPEGHFEDRGRARTLPMVRGFAEVSEARFWSSDYF